MMSKAKIIKTEIYKLNVPLKEPFVISLGSFFDATNLLVRIHTDNGLVGTGECSPLVFIVGETQESEFIHTQKIAGLSPEKMAEKALHYKKSGFPALIDS